MAHNIAPMGDREPTQVPGPQLDDKEILTSYILIAIIIVFFLILLVRIFAGNKTANVKGPVVIDVQRTRHIEVKDLAKHLQTRREKLVAVLAGRLSVLTYKPQLEKITKNLKKFIDQIPDSAAKIELEEAMAVAIHSQEGSLEYEDNKKTGKECLNELVGHMEMIESALQKGLIQNGFLDLTPMTELLLSLEGDLQNAVLSPDKKPVENISLTAGNNKKIKGLGESTENYNHIKYDKEFKRGYGNVLGSMEFEAFD